MDETDVEGVQCQARCHDKELVEDKIVNLEHVATERQLVDIFITALDAVQFEKLKGALGFFLIVELQQLQLELCANGYILFPITTTTSQGDFVIVDHDAVVSAVVYEFHKKTVETAPESHVELNIESHGDVVPITNVSTTSPIYVVEPPSRFVVFASQTDEDEHIVQDDEDEVVHVVEETDSDGVPITKSVVVSVAARLKEKRKKKIAKAPHRSPRTNKDVDVVLAKKKGKNESRNTKTRYLKRKKVHVSDSETNAETDVHDIVPSAEKKGRWQDSSYECFSCSFGQCVIPF